MSGPLTPGSRMNPLSPQDPITQLNTFKSYVAIIGDPATNIAEKKLKAAQELCESFELIGSLPQYPQFIGEAVKVFLKLLQESEPVFISEYTNQQLRKMLLELIHRIPSNDHLKPYVASILSLMFHLLKVDCEDNVLVALRIIIELSKQFRPQYNADVANFLRYVKDIYKLLPTHTDKLFEHRTQFKVSDIGEADVKALLQEIFVMTTIVTEKKNSENQNVSYNLLPRAEKSLKVLAELPIIVVLMYQLYKQQAHAEVAEFIPLVMTTISMQPTQQQRTSANFNKEVYVDFAAAQIKTLSFLAYIIRIYQDPIAAHSAQMVQGMLDLFAHCPSEVAHLRKELLIAARHILATDLRMKFVPHIEKLFDESMLIGTGWTAHESLRPLAYSTLADLVHHIRGNLSLSDLSMAVNLFSKNIHDDTLPTGIQNMSCKLLLNLVEIIRGKSDTTDTWNGRELLLRTLEVFVLKFKAIAEIQMPYLLSKCKQVDAQGKPITTGQQGSSPSTPSHQQQGPTGTPVVQKQKSALGESKENEVAKASSATGSLTPGGGATLGLSANEKDDNKVGKTLSSSTTSQLYSVVECRGLVKTLVSGVKTITWGLSNCKAPSIDMMMIQNKQLLPKETLVYIRLVRCALLALDIYTINTTPQGQTQVRPPSNAQTVRTKEEKEVLEHFAGVFIMMSTITFKEIFSTMVEYMVTRIHCNYALQIIANSFLASSTTSATFATILVEFLLKHMDEMGSNADKSSLYLKLFKLVFGSVSLLANENEQMLKPHLHTIVNRAMELARTAKDPYNYFLLLRALFRSIGGGSHDLLYQEFLPLLPNLLQGLNNLQSGLHRQHMKDLFVELCLTVPVRLSSLLPYLPMLMDPLVSALNGSQTLVSQGLRTLELCVDNLQPDFLFSHIEPVKAELMQALWHCLNSPNDSTASVAFRVLGKFGGSNRKVIHAPQKLARKEFESTGPIISVTFHDSPQPVPLPVDLFIDTAFTLLKTTPVPPATSSSAATTTPTLPNNDLFYKQHAWNLVKSYLTLTVAVDDKAHQPSENNQGMTPSVVDNSAGYGDALFKMFSHSSFQTLPKRSDALTICFCMDEHFRSVQQKALAAMLVASSIKELFSSEILEFVVSTVTHYTLVAISQQTGPKATTNKEKLEFKDNLDPQVLLDAIVMVMGLEDRDLSASGLMALAVTMKVTMSVLGSEERVFSLPFYEYLSEKILLMCHERSWYHKMGGCEGIKFLNDNASIEFMLEHQVAYLKALLFVVLDLSGEVSNGAMTLAKTVMQEMCTKCCRAVDGLKNSGSVIGAGGGEDKEADLRELHAKSSSEVIKELARQICCANQLVREQAVSLLKMLAELKGCSVTELIEPIKEVFADMIPPKKHLLRFQPALIQMGIMEGNAFCLSLEPRLITVDLNVIEHKLFYQELSNICETDDANLLRLNCYKNISDFTQLRISAIKVLSTLHYIAEVRSPVFQILYKALNSNNSELQDVAFNCLKKFVSGFSMDSSVVNLTMRPELQCLQDFSLLDLHKVKVISSLIHIFPNTFNEKLCEQMLVHLKKWFETSALPQNLNQTKITGQVVPMEQKMCSAIINMFHLMVTATPKFIDPLVRLTLKGEKDLFIEASSPFREPLLKFLKRYPEATVDHFFHESRLQDSHYNRFFLWLVDQEESQAFREILMNSISRLLNLTIQQYKNTEQQFFAICVIKTLVDHDGAWLIKQSPVVTSLLIVWASPEFHERHQNIGSVEYFMWQEPTSLLHILLSFFKHHTNELELLFHMLRCFTGKYVPQFTFFKEFLEETVAKTYSTEWKRNAFFKFVEIFHQNDWSHDVKTKILQHVLIPCFTSSFDKEEDEQLIGGPPTPDLESDDNIISIFISKVVDPDNPFGTSDALRIFLLQLSCLFVERASRYIHDVANKRQGNKLRRLMTFAWPCLLTKTCVDPATKYHGHLLLSHIIAKFAIHKRIVLQVFHSLLKAHAVEARVVVRQALEVLTPAMPGRMEDENNMLTHWTKKIIVEEGHTIAQLVHVLQLIFRHHKVYYPVRHHLVQNLSSSIQRLGLTPTATAEHRRLAVDLAEVIIIWEIQRIKEDAEEGQSSSSSKEINKPIDKAHCDTVVNFLLRIACQASEAAGSPGEQLSRRCIALLKKALSPEVWPNAEVKVAWFDKILNSVEGQQPNIYNICTALELLTFLLGFLKKETILSNFKALQRGVAGCMGCPNLKVIRAVHQLLSKLMGIFPTEPAASTVASKYEELECLYACVSKQVYEGLANYEKAPQQQLFSTLMILKAACQSNPSYIDRLITSFMKVLQKMVKDHLTNSTPSAGGAAAPAAATSEAGGTATELLIHSLDLVKNRVGVMSPEMRKIYIISVLTSLIDKTTDTKIIKAIIKMIEEWVKNKSQIAINQSPNVKEKVYLLNRLQPNLEKRFPDDLELNAQFLELINFIYCDESLKSSDYISKLETPFLAGLRSSQPHIRQWFADVFDANIEKLAWQRIFYIISSQNWEPMSAHYWIKQCIELILNSVNMESRAFLMNNHQLLPPLLTTADLNSSQESEKAEGQQAVPKAADEAEPMEWEDNEEPPQVTPGEESIMAQVEAMLGSTCTGSTPDEMRRNMLVRIAGRQVRYLQECCQVKIGPFIRALIQLCHDSTSLAHDTWLLVFPRVWKIIPSISQRLLPKEIVKFMSSGNHMPQRDSQPSSLKTFLEAVLLCSPTIYVRPVLLKYLAKSHNVWHRSLMTMEEEAFSIGVFDKQLYKQNRDHALETEVVSNNLELLESLAQAYKSIKEEDMFVAVWIKRARKPATLSALAFEQQGMFGHARDEYLESLCAARDLMNTVTVQTIEVSELQLQSDHVIRCMKELNEWEALELFAQESGVGINLDLILQCSWRSTNWPLAKNALTAMELDCPREELWKMNMYRGYLAICHYDDQPLSSVEKLVEMATNLAVREWRRLPHIVSHAHIELLQASQQIIELQEAASLNNSIQPSVLGREQSNHDIKAIIKTWRNRMPAIMDDLCHWSDIFMWRQIHFHSITSASGDLPNETAQQNATMLGIHHTAVGLVEFGKVARKHGLTDVCINTLDKIHSIPSVPAVDCFQKVKQQVKCYLQLASTNGMSELQQGVDILDSMSVRYFNKEMISEFYAYRAAYMSFAGKSAEAYQLFSAAAQLSDTTVKTWALWGEYLEGLFLSDTKMTDNGMAAITSFLLACRTQSETKARKYLAKVFWLLTFDDDKQTLTETFEKHNAGIPTHFWIIWIPQLLSLLARNEGRVMTLLSKVGTTFPQAVYFPTRTLYLTLRLEHRGRFKSDSQTKSSSTSSSSSSSMNSALFSPPPADLPNDRDPQPAAATATASTAAAARSSASSATSAVAVTEPVGPIKATSGMWRCSRVLQNMRDSQTTVLSTLECIVDQMVLFRDNWYEEVLKQVKQAMDKCFEVAFEQRGNASDQTVATPRIINFIKKVVQTFGVGPEVAGSSSSGISSIQHQALVSMSCTTPLMFQKIRAQLVSDFDFSIPGSTRLFGLTARLKKWTKILEYYINNLPKTLIMEERCKFLSSFSTNMADIELPGEFLVPQQNSYYVKIERFLPKVEVVQKMNTAARRLYIRGHNGKIYPYLVINDACMTESRREERVLQLFRMLNVYFAKNKETARRMVHISVPRIVALAPQLRLVEDNPNSITLLSIFKQNCARRSQEHDLTIFRYYEKFAGLRLRHQKPTQQHLTEFFKNIQVNLVPRSTLRDWALNSYTSATDFWTFRKNMTIHVGLLGFIEYCFHLTRLDPDMMFIHQDSGFVSVPSYRFAVREDDGTLDGNRPVPFRLTPSIVELLTTTSVMGPMIATMISIARCVVQPQYKVQSLICAILRDEFMAWHKKEAKIEKQKEKGEIPVDKLGEVLSSLDIPREELAKVVMKASQDIQVRLSNMSMFNKAESQVPTLVFAADCVDNLCRMDPAWYPWL